MSTEPSFPETTVEIAFGSGYTTPAASRTWTDVSDVWEHEEGLEIAVGRGDERSVADANTISLTIRNISGDFTPGNSSGAYYPDVKIGTPIRVTTTPVGGTDSTRFVGHVDEWLVGWDGTDEYSSVEITASSRFSRLGLDTAATSLVRQTIINDEPLLYYPLGEAAGARTSADLSGNGQLALNVVGSGTDVGFGSTSGGAAVDGGTCVEFANGKYLRRKNLFTTDYSTITVEFLFATTSAATATDFLVVGNLEPGDLSGVVFYWVSGDLNAATQDASGTAAGFASRSGYNDGNLHHVAVTWNTGTDVAKWYIDGALNQTISTAGLASISARSVSIVVGSGYTGTASHVAVFDSELSADQIAVHAEAALTQFAGETTSDRIARYSSWGSVPATALDLDAGAVTLDAVDTTDKQVLDLMREAETSEGGVLFDAPDGTLTYRARATRYTTTPDVTLDFGRQEIGADFAPRLDRLSLLNDVTVTTTDGTRSGRSINTTSRDEYGPAVGSIETQAQGEDDPSIRAAWTVYVYGTPTSRVTSLTVDVPMFGEAPTQNDILALTVGSLICCTTQPDQAAASTGYYFVEGYSESITGTTHTITFNVSPADAWMNVVTFDDADRGFDSGAVFAY